LGVLLTEAGSFEGRRLSLGQPSTESSVTKTYLNTAIPFGTFELSRERENKGMLV